MQDSANSQNSTPVTRLLREIEAGDARATERLFECVYGELRKLAGGYLHRERGDHTVQATALVHEAYLRLIGKDTISFQNRAHFFSVAAQVMRNILVDHARRHGAEKRGGGNVFISLDEAVGVFTENNVNLILLDTALRKLAAFDERQSRIVEMRFFGGLTLEETAAALDLSAVTINKEWNFAKAWLYREIFQK